MENQKRVVRVSKKAAIIASIIIILGIVAWIFFIKPQSRVYQTGGVSGVEGGQNVVAPQAENSSSIAYPDYGRPYFQDNSSAKDTPEFMKGYYNTEIRTRDVKDVTRDVKSAIHDTDGR